MDDDTTRPLIWVLAIVAIALVVAVVYQHLRINDLTEAQAAATARTDALQADVATLENDVAVLARIVGRLTAAGGNAPDADLAAIDSQPESLPPGVYILAPVVGAAGTDLEAYTIYHASATVSAGDFQRDIHFGVARSGLLSWLLYFDYDNDGDVDSDMLREFVDSIPFGGFVSGTFDAGRSQAAYDRFLLETDEADYYPPELINEQGGEVARQMWSYVTSTSEQLALWVMSQLPDDAEAADPESE